MRRFWILFVTELKAWRYDPLPTLGGFIPTLTVLIAFGLLFGGRLTFKIAVLNNDAGVWGDALRGTFAEVQSPFGTPYYDVFDLSADEAWSAYRAHRLDGVWVIPADFSTRLQAGQQPRVEIYFDNYNDDRAKNHRIYAAEILWRFYEKAGLPAPPLSLAEEYPRDEMVGWFPIIAVGVMLLSVTIGAMFNVFLLTNKELVSGIVLEFGLMPRSLGWVMLPKLLLALVMGLFTGAVFMGLLRVWPGIWPGRYLWAVGLLCGLVALFWIAWALLFGLRMRAYFAGAAAIILTGLTVFFIGGGMSPVRGWESKVLFVAWLFPNTHVIDALRDLILFHTWPADWRWVLLKLIGFAAVSLGIGLGMAARRLRRWG